MSTDVTEGQVLYLYTRTPQKSAWFSSLFEYDGLVGELAARQAFFDGLSPIDNTLTVDDITVENLGISWREWIAEGDN